MMLNKVPEVTVYFWIIKILCTTVGETGADNLPSRYNLSDATLAYYTGAFLVAALACVSRSGGTCRCSTGPGSS